MNVYADFVSSFPMFMKFQQWQETIMKKGFFFNYTHSAKVKPYQFIYWIDNLIFAIGA